MNEQVAVRAPVSVIVPVKNEAANLRRCLACLRWADEVFVVDSQSTDDTGRIAEEMGARVVQFHFNGSYPKKKNWSLENVPFRNEWVLIVDADELVPPALAAEIAAAVAVDKADGYLINRRFHFLGRWIRHCGYYPSWNLRLFKHRLGRYERVPVRPGSQTGDNEAHEHVVLQGRVERLRGDMLHYAYPDIATWVEKHNRYSNWEAEVRRRLLGGGAEVAEEKIAGRGLRWKRALKRLYLRLPFPYAVRFVYAYVFRLGFLDGRPGFILCVLLSFYDFLTWAKIQERRLSGASRDASSECQTGSQP